VGAAGARFLERPRGSDANRRAFEQLLNADETGVLNDGDMEGEFEEAALEEMGLHPRADMDRLEAFAESASLLQLDAAPTPLKESPPPKAAPPAASGATRDAPPSKAAPASARPVASTGNASVAPPAHPPRVPGWTEAVIAKDMGVLGTLDAEHAGMYAADAAQWTLFEVGWPDALRRPVQWSHPVTVRSVR
jgi:hypothetical protein